MRDMGGEFAAEFPKIAARLGLGNTEVADPYVERLLEGFAFLTARVQLKMEAEFPTFTQSLLQMVYPHYLAPTPSMAVVRFQPDASLRAMPDGVLLPPGTELRSLLGTEDQTNCEFRTAHPVQLLPIEVAEAEYIGSPAAVAALGLPDRAGQAREGGHPPAPARDRRHAVQQAGAGPARVLPGRGGRRADAAVRAAVCNVVQVYARPTTRPLPWQESAAGQRRPPARLRAGGGAAAPGAAILRRLPPAAGILRAAGAVPVRRHRGAGPRRDPLHHRARWRSSSCSTGRTRCWRAASTPGRCCCSARRRSTCSPGAATASTSDGANRREHQVVPDRMRPLDFEVFDVRGVEGYGSDGSAPQRFLPFYAANDLSRQPEHQAYYTLRRQPRQLSSRSRQRGPRSSYLGPRRVHRPGGRRPGADRPRPAPAGAGPAVHQPGPAAVHAGRAAGDGLHHPGQRARGLRALRRRADPAAPVPQRRRATPGASSAT